MNLFADATDDHQWIHVDTERAVSGPFGTTIAHGYLTLSLLPRMLDELLVVTDQVRGTNYGIDRLGSPTLVPVGSRIRLEARIAEAKPRDDGGVQYKIAFRVQVQDWTGPPLSANRSTWRTPIPILSRPRHSEEKHACLPAHRVQRAQRPGSDRHRCARPVGGEILLQVRALGVNFLDLLMTKAIPEQAGSTSPPSMRRSPALWSAPRQAPLAARDRAAAFVWDGGFAEYVAVGPNSIVPLPDSVDFEFAAAMVVNYHTVHFALAPPGRRAAR